MPSLRCTSCLATLAAGRLLIPELAAVPADDSALSVSLTATGEYWQNAAGGIATETWWNTLADLGFTFDLARLRGPAHSTLFAQVHAANNRDDDTCLADATGAFNPVSGLMAGDHLRAFNLYYRQSWCDDACTLKIGQLAIDDDVMLSDYACAFMNSAFGAMPSQVATGLCRTCHHAGAFPIYSVAAPGLWLQLRPTASFSWQTGLYYGAPGFDTTDNHGFDWQGTSHSGAVVFTEAGWNYLAAGHDAALRLGAAYHGGKFDNYAALLAAQPDTETRSLSSVYVVHDLVLATDAAGRPEFAAFTRLGVSPQTDRSVVGFYGDAGLTWSAPFRGRPDDLAGVAVSCTHFGHSFRATAPDVPAATETTLEFTYRAQLTARLNLQADAQLLFDPARNSAGRRETACVLGLRTQFSF